ncbi:multiheme c-type cytochrome [Paludisphaera borealis]|uniref:Perchlorate reductase subunit gamma n=1 Tax=Paludisphaera borealis TaxID=1387353 RepID=A0A1U7CPM4_9BACT|nr:multiheme c-type cytochrome [Paludisphaera borealis]APW60871.1 Perchlorate reductase subunit gamma [Paludisphaera borealis]
MPRLPFRPLGAVATAIALLTYVGCSSSSSKDDKGTSSATPGGAKSPAADASKAEPAGGRSSTLFAQWPKPAAVLVVSGEMDGYLEPCGCTQGQLGGLIRRYDFIERLRAQNWPYALIDLGSLIKDPAAARGGFEQAKIKFSIALKALSTFKYNAVALSADDLKVGVGEAMAQFLNNLTEPTKILAANVVPGPGFETIIQPSTIVAAGTVKLGVTAVIDPENIAKLSDPDKDELLPTVKRADDVLPSILAELEGKSDYQVLMVQGSPDEAKRLASAYPGFDIVVSTSAIDDPEQDPQMLNNGKTMLVNVGRRGKYVGAVGFFNDGAKTRYYRVSLNERYDGPATEVKKVIEDEYRSMLKEIGTVENFPRHDYVNGAPGATFAGAESCKTCHPNTFLKWSSTKHALAFESLLRDPKPNTIYDAECVTCHTTGFEYTSGWRSEAATPLLKGNQCENCHGPASKHVAEPDDLSFRKAIALTAQQVDKNRTCYRCHDDDNSPKFDFATYWGKVIHKGLDTYTDPKVHQGAAPKAGKP